MAQQDHLTDAMLLDIIYDDSDLGQTEIETHISECNQCQTRLLSLADGDWLNRYRDCLTVDILSAGSAVPDMTYMERKVGRSRLDVDLQAEEEEQKNEAIQSLLDRLLAPPTHPETLGRLGRYEVESVIGVGGMGIVLRAYDRELQRPVAIKSILPRLANRGTAKQRFTREARAVAAILHPNVVAIHGVDETNGVPWFVMPFIPGPTLRELVEQNGPLPEREIARIGLQIASGLAAAHGQGLVHRDIKPENILVDNQINRVVITDFGLAQRDSEEGITKTGVLAGTLNYMSPEQAKGETLDGRSDLFSLGSLLYYLATGVVPFRSDSLMGVMHRVVNQKHEDVRSHNPEISRALAETIDLLLSKEPSQRFQSASQLESYFESFVSHLNHPTHSELPKVPRTAKRSTVWRAIGISAVVIVCLSVALARNYWQPKEASPSPAAIWGELQTKYDLESPAEFSESFDRFSSQVQQLQRSMNRGNDSQSDPLTDSMQQMERQIRQLDEQLK